MTWHSAAGLDARLHAAGTRHQPPGTCRLSRNWPTVHTRALAFPRGGLLLSRQFSVSPSPKVPQTPCRATPARRRTHDREGGGRGSPARPRRSTQARRSLVIDVCGACAAGPGIRPAWPDGRTAHRRCRTTSPCPATRGTGSRTPEQVGAGRRAGSTRWNRPAIRAMTWSNIAHQRAGSGLCPAATARSSGVRTTPDDHAMAVLGPRRVRDKIAKAD